MSMAYNQGKMAWHEDRGMVAARGATFSQLNAQADDEWRRQSSCKKSCKISPQCARNMWFVSKLGINALLLQQPHLVKSCILMRNLETEGQYFGNFSYYPTFWWRKKDTFDLTDRAVSPSSEMVNPLKVISSTNGLSHSALPIHDSMIQSQTALPHNDFIIWICEITI